MLLIFEDPSELAPSKNSTVPVKPAPTIVAVKVIFEPAQLGFVFEANEVVVLNFDVPATCDRDPRFVVLLNPVMVPVKVAVMLPLFGITLPSIDLTATPEIVSLSLVFVFATVKGIVIVVEVNVIVPTVMSGVAGPGAVTDAVTPLVLNVQPTGACKTN